METRPATTATGAAPAQARRRDGVDLPARLPSLSPAVLLMREGDDTPAPHPLALEARGVAVRYDLRFTRRTTLRGSIAGALRPRRRRADDEVWALRGVDLEIARGEALGIIGPNGAGKSTLLQVLAGVLEPAEGTVRVAGRISALLSIAAGFDASLSGRENIYLGAALSGVGRREMEAREPDIIGFTRLGRFIDAPMSTYSTGMRARLGFAIATALDPDLLLIDEVLGTGDAEFRAASRDRMQALIGRAGGVVVVSHDTTWVSRFCSRAILLEQGRVVMAGDPVAVCAAHRDRSLERRRAALVTPETPTSV